VTPHAALGTVAYALERAVEVAGRPGHADGDAETLPVGLEALDASGFLEFDIRARCWSSGLGPGEAGLRQRQRPSAALSAE